MTGRTVGGGDKTGARVRGGKNPGNRGRRARAEIQETERFEARERRGAGRCFLLLPIICSPKAPILDEIWLPYDQSSVEVDKNQRVFSSLAAGAFSRGMNV